VAEPLQPAEGTSASHGGDACLRVAVAVPLATLFDYLPPPGVDIAGIAPGSRVLVPFGRGRRVGLVLSIASGTDQAPERLRPALGLLDPGPLLSALDLELIQWAAEYYRHPVGEALFGALPARLRRPQPLLDERPRGWRLTAAGRSQDPERLRRAPRQAAVLERLRTAAAAGAELAQTCGNCSATLRALAVKGWIEACAVERPIGHPIAHPTDRAAERAPAPQIRTVQPPDLNAEQAEAVTRVRESSGFRAFLLDGVTGSGKTEVYLRLVGDVLAAGRQALVLVPEIGLTPQLERRIRARIRAPMAVIHSGLTERDRELAWRAAASGAAALVLGTRSAVFAPLPALGLVVVDEEHDISFKQQDGFRYSARDLALRRAQRAGCPAILGSATPSLESLLGAQRGRYVWLHLTERAGGAQTPRLDVVDIRAQPLQGGLSRVLVRDLTAEIAAGNQVLLFLNRRGFSPILTCHDCGWVGDCPHCDARLTLHLVRPRLMCHHCGWSRGVPEACPACGKADLRALGQGTERLEEELQRLFPDVPVARIDRDSSRGGRLARLLEGARRGDFPILIGTQMLAKGHHLPGVTLVGILDLDQGLYGADYRAPERMAQLIVQVAGRAGRAERPGRVVLQTRHPDHPMLAALLAGGYRAFAETALAERRAASLPPFSHQALLRAEAPAPQQALHWLAGAAQLAAAIRPPGLALWGPVPAPMERRAGRFRAQLLVQSDQRPVLQTFLASWVPRLRSLKGEAALRWSLDVDPQEML